MGSMSEAAEEIRAIEDTKVWLRRLCDEYLKLELLFPAENFLPEEGLPKWVQNVEREVGAMMYPVARLKDELNLTPRRVGAILGHSCAFAVWMMEALAYTLDKTDEELDLSKFTPEQLEHGTKFLRGVLEDWYPGLRRLAKRALCSSVGRTYEEMTAFLLAYSEAFSKKPKQFGLADIGNSAFEIYFFMLNSWRFVDSLKSVHELHECLVKVYGPYRVGELKRVEKICQRIELRYRKPGRPKKAK